MQRRKGDALRQKTERIEKKIFACHLPAPGAQDQHKWHQTEQHFYRKHRAFIARSQHQCCHREEQRQLCPWIQPQHQTIPALVKCLRKSLRPSRPPTSAPRNIPTTTSAKLHGGITAITCVAYSSP